MALLMENDYNFPLPKMHRVRQNFDHTFLEDVEGTVRAQFLRPEIREKIRPGSRVAVAVGSRGISNLPLIVRTTIEEIRALGGEPFIVSAMGSHGEGTPEGQREVLYGYGITEEAMGVPVVTEVDVVRLGETSRGIQVYFDKTAYEADVIVPINRVKLHTDFVSDIQSGLCKMLVIGLGNRQGCSAIHEDDFETFGDTIKEAAAIILEKAPVGFGMAILENAYDQTYAVEALPRETLIEREKELVKQARKNMPILMIPEIDILVVEEIGKDISGAGFDPNILGKSYILKEFVLEVPKINRMVLLDITPASHGNGIGLGVFDIITKKVFEQLNYQAMYANAIAIKVVDDCKVPLIAEDEREALLVAVKILRHADLDNLRIVKIRSTLELGEIQVSDALVPVVEQDSRLTLLD